VTDISCCMRITERWQYWSCHYKWRFPGQQHRFALLLQNHRQR